MPNRLVTLLLTLIVSGPAWAQDSTLGLPVSMQKIREGVAQPGPQAPLKGLDIAAQPTFHVDITEQQTFDELMSKIRYEAPGPIPAEGIDAHEQQRRLFPPVNNPLVQPYAAFTSGQLATIGLEALLERYVGGPAIDAIDAALRARAEREANDEVAQNLAAYWAARERASGERGGRPPR